MRRFLIQVCVFSLLPLTVCLVALSRLSGYTDPFYLRFTTPKQHSLIIGTSRAAQGLQPVVTNNILHRHDMFNYAFTIAHSPFGETYFKSIKSKLAPGTKDGIYIVAVDPWSISNTSKDPDDADNFAEQDFALGKMSFVNMNPNIFYIFCCYDKPLITLVKKNKDFSTFLHKDGWLEVTVPMDSVTVSTRLREKIFDYQTNYLPKFKFSNIRWQYLIKTISFLQMHGKVYLVRLPVHDEIYRIEAQLMKGFDDKMNTLAKELNVPYKNVALHGKAYEYTDGNHLTPASGKKVSAEVAEWIYSL